MYSTVNKAQKRVSTSPMPPRNAKRLPSVNANVQRESQSRSGHQPDSRASRASNTVAPSALPQPERPERHRGRAHSRQAPNFRNDSRRSPTAESFPELDRLNAQLHSDNSESDTGSPVSDNTDPPPVIRSPIKRRAREAAPGINKMSDAEVYGLPDATIIGKPTQVSDLEQQT
ncbi:hypothetical protein BJ165DRAFT_774013 [Panaeolus papilionaceus]|nr:hypothetical protein BJ165DRAFT_774013 [Panaeolus papilionaceus]